MKRLTQTLCLLALIISAHAADSSKPMQAEVRELPEATSKSTISLNSKFLLAAPASSPAAAPLTLLIFLHGAGQRGADIEVLRAQQPLKYFSTQTKQPFSIIMPQCRAGAGGVHRTWEVTDLELLFAHLEKTLRFDKTRVYLVGYSMGTTAPRSGRPRILITSPSQPRMQVGSDTAAPRTSHPILING